MADEVTEMAKSPQPVAVEGAPRPPRSNVVSGGTFKREISRALSAIANVAAGTLGPHGRHAIIIDKEGQHHATKDGHSVIKRLTFVEPIPNMVLDTVHSVTRRIVQRVGDGSTSSVVIADKLFHALEARDLTECFPAGSVAAAISGVSQALSDRVTANAWALAEKGKVVDLPTLARVAAISANNDPQLGEMVASVYAESANLRVSVREADSRQSDTTVEITTGFRCKFGYSHDMFANVTSATGGPGRVEFEKTAVFVFAGELKMEDITFFAPLVQYHVNRGQSLVIVAGGFAKEAENFLLEPFRSNTPVRLALIDHAFTLPKYRQALDDLTMYLGVTAVTPESCPRAEDARQATPEEMAAILAVGGYADSVSIHKSEAFFRRNEVPLVVGQAIAEIEAAVSDLEDANVSGASSETIAEFRDRLMALTGRAAVILAGGESRQEKAALRDLLEDAALACEAAVKSGISEGLGLPVLWELHHNWNQVVSEAVAICKAKTRLPERLTKDVCNEVAGAFQEAYSGAFLRVLANSHVNERQEILKACVEGDIGFDAVTGLLGKPDEFVVPVPSLTDSEILLGVASVVSLLIVTDQAVMPTAADAAVSAGV